MDIDEQIIQLPTRNEGLEERLYTWDQWDDQWEGQQGIQDLSIVYKEPSNTVE